MMSASVSSHHLTRTAGELALLALEPGRDARRAPLSTFVQGASTELPLGRATGSEELSPRRRSDSVALTRSETLAPASGTRNGLLEFSIVINN